MPCYDVAFGEPNLVLFKENYTPYTRFENIETVILSENTYMWCVARFGVIGTI